MKAECYDDAPVWAFKGENPCLILHFLVTQQNPQSRKIMTLNDLQTKNKKKQGSPTTFLGSQGRVGVRGRGSGRVVGRGGSPARLGGLPPSLGIDKG